MTKRKSEEASATKEFVKDERGLPALLKKYEKEIKFVLTGGFNTLLDFVIFNSLKSLAGLNPLFSNIISTSVCIAVSFYLNYKYVWKSTKSKRETAPGFLVVSLFSAWVVQSLTIHLVLWLIHDGAIQAMIAKLCASAFGMISNYFGYKVVFSVNIKKLLRSLKTKNKE